MKYRMLDLIICPKCKRNLDLHSFKEEMTHVSRTIESPRCDRYCGLMRKQVEKIKKDVNCTSCYEREITEGLLICKCNYLIPIIDRIPRAIGSKLESYPNFLSMHRRKIEQILPEASRLDIIGNDALSEDLLSIHNSFSEEWSFFDFERDKTWGWTAEDRKKVFLSEIGIEEDKLKNKILLDAGCGNGIFSSILTDFGMEIIGIDISNSVLRAEKNKKKFAKNNDHFVHFFQGNLLNLPLRSESFDFIYSSGVLHHCPDTYEAFIKIIPFIKKDGRVYIWVYGKRGVIVKIFMAHGRYLRKYLSLKKLYKYCRTIAPFYKLASHILTSLKIYEFSRRTVREITLDLFDAFSPKYNHSHTMNEVCNWFEEQGFKNIKVCGVKKHGFGVRGDRK